MSVILYFMMAHIYVFHSPNFYAIYGFIVLLRFWNLTVLWANDNQWVQIIIFVQLYQHIYSRLFELRSIGIIDESFVHDPNKAMDLIDSYADAWQIISSPLAFAHENLIYDVVAHPCSKMVIHRKWYDIMQPNLQVKYWNQIVFF